VNCNRLAALIAALFASAVPAAAAAQEAEPLVSAFNETCRRGFPDVETIARHAAAQGWVERASRLIAEGTDPKVRNIAPPRFLQKGEMMLILSSPNRLSARHICSVHLGVGKTLDTAALAALVSAALGAGQPAMKKVDGVDQAEWQPAPAFLVSASVRKKPARSATIAVRTQP
jgi:hypothetical protein